MKSDTIVLIAVGIGAFVLINGFTKGAVSKAMGSGLIRSGYETVKGALTGIGTETTKIYKETGVYTPLKVFNSFNPLSYDYLGWSWLRK